VDNNANDFLGFLFFESCECPKCGTMVTQEEVEGNLNEEKDTFICPYRNQASDISELG
jgi:hypothetical protein